jgi:hypothetical protein
MRQAVDRTLQGRREFDLAVVETLNCARRDLFFIDHDFQRWPIQSAAFETALREALLRGASLTVLVVQPDWLAREGDRFMRLRRRFSSAISVRQIPATLRVEESALLADDQHLLRRTHYTSQMARLLLASPSLVEGLSTRYRAIRDESTDCLPATTIGL